MPIFWKISVPMSLKHHLFTGNTKLLAKIECISTSWSHEEQSPPVKSTEKDFYRGTLQVRALTCINVFPLPRFTPHVTFYLLSPYLILSDNNRATGWQFTRFSSATTTASSGLRLGCSSMHLGQHRVIRGWESCFHESTRKAGHVDKARNKGRLVGPGLHPHGKLRRTHAGDAFARKRNHTHKN